MKGYLVLENGSIFEGERIHQEIAAKKRVKEKTTETSHLVHFDAMC